MTDLISRSAVLAIGNVRRVTEYDEAGYDMSYDAVPVEAIEVLPALDVAPVVHARWKWPTNFTRSLLFYCSKCGTHSHFKTMYCSSCGARMDGEADG